jgi:competence protein ComEA
MNPLDQHYRKILIFLILVILAGNAYWIVRHFKPELFLGEPHLNVGVEIEKASSNEPKARQPLEVQPPKVVVHVVGAVQSPGVYQIEMGARINDAVELAGGATDEADLNQLNLAAKVRDEEQIFVPSKLSETVSPPSSPVRSSVPTPQSPTGRSFPTARQPINLNTATSKQLQTVPGIGPVTAQRIIDYRRTHGRFSTVDDLIAVKGIGQKTLEEIRVHVVAR